MSETTGSALPTLPTETVKDLAKAARKGEWGTVMGNTLTLRNFFYAVASGKLDISAVPSRSKTAFRKAAETAAQAVSDARPKGPSKRTLVGGKLTFGQAAAAARQELDILSSLLD